MSNQPDYYTRALKHLGTAATPAVTARDPVNLPMIRRWCEAMGEENPIYVDTEAASAQGFDGIACPPAMLEVWTMSRYRPEGRQEDESIEVLTIFDEAGFTGVVATNVEQEYDRYLIEGDVVSYTSVVDEISDEKRTGLGIGHFVTIRYEFSDQSGEPVGRMLFRILKFRPNLAPPATQTKSDSHGGSFAHPRPTVTHDNAHYWEGIARGELLIQRCTGCHHLRHPPGPACPVCHSLEWDAVQATGKGTLHSFVNVHQPRVPSLKYPLPVLLVELEEGVRIVANAKDLSADDLTIGMPMELDFQEVEPGLVLPCFVAAQG